MTLDEVIRHAEEVAEANECLCEQIHPALQWKDYGKCASEHRQLADWLKDYKRLLEHEPCEDATLKDIFCMGCEYKEQEPKTGHWKRISMDKYSEHAKYWYRCDRCGKDNLGNTDWCPNCGAKMIDPQESEKINCKTTKCENCKNHNYCDFEPQESEVNNG